VDDITPLKEVMLTDIKDVLKQFKHVDTYAGYQIIAELWEAMLAEDTEKIANSNFYTVAKLREANMVEKGSGKSKRTVQEGWIGALVPKELIKSHLFKDELLALEDKEVKLTSINSEIDELVEAAKVEESEEAVALADSLNAREDDFTVGRSEERRVGKECRCRRGTWQ